MILAKSINAYRTVLALVLLLIAVNYAAQSALDITSPADSTKHYFLDEITLRWQSDDDMPAALYYSIDGGTTRQLIAENLLPTGNAPYQWEYVWTLPELPAYELTFYAEQHSPTYLSLLAEVLNAHDDEIRAIHFSPDGSEILTAARNNKLNVWNSSNLQLMSISNLGIPETAIYEAKYVASADTVLVANTSSVIAWLRADEKPDKILVAAPKNDYIRALDIDRSGQYFAVGTNEGEVSVWQINNQLGTISKIRSYDLSENRIIYDLTFSPDGQRLAFCDIKQIYEVNWTDANAMPREIGAHGDEGGSTVVWSLDYSNDGQRLASTGNDHSVRVWDLTTATQLMKYDGHELNGRAVKHFPQNDLMASGGLDGLLKIWNSVEYSPETMIMGNNQGGIISLDISPSGDTIATAGRDNAFRLWKLHEGWHEEDSLHIKMKYKGFASIADVSGEQGEAVEVPISLRHDYTLQFLADKSYEADLTLNYPFELLELISADGNSVADNPYSFPFYSEYDNPVMTTLNGRILRGSKMGGEIVKDDFLLTRNDVFDIFWIDSAIVETEIFCQGEEEFRLAFNDSKIDIKIYPSPATDAINVRIFVPSDEISQLKMFDYYGKEIMRREFLGMGNTEHEVKFDLSGLAAGKYFITYNSGRHEIQADFVVVR